MKDDLIGHDGIALADLIRKMELKPIELLEIVIHRVEKLNPHLNAVIHKMYDQARVSAKSWEERIGKGEARNAIFCGVPFLLKDLTAECKGAPLHEGSRAVKGYFSKLDSALVKRQKASGLVILGKTNASEFGLLPTTEPLLYGPTANPWNPALTPGGSSGGSAAAVAAGIVPLAHGNDGGGSIRIPASCCGLFGLKPTRGRNSLGPLFGDLGSGIVHEHALTRTVRDSAALLDATSGPVPGDPYWAPPKERPFLEEVGREPGRLKIGFLTRVPDGWYEPPELHPDCEAAVKDAARLCQDLGHIVEEIAPDELQHREISVFFGRVFTCVTAHSIAYWERELNRKIKEEELEPITWAMYQAGLRHKGADYLQAIEEIQRFARRVAEWYEEGGFDLLLSPTMRIPPTPLGAFAFIPDDKMQWLEATLSFVVFTRVQNMTGQPAMSIPLFWNKDRIPVGVQLAGRFGAEATLFRLAAQLEQTRPWANRWPPVSAFQ